MAASDPLRYRAFLLQIGVAPGPDSPPAVHRLVLTDARTRQRRTFDSPESLVAYLERVIATMYQDAGDTRGLPHAGDGDEVEGPPG